MEVERSVLKRYQGKYFKSDDYYVHIIKVNSFDERFHIAYCIADFLIRNKDNMILRGRPFMVSDYSFPFVKSNKSEFYKAYNDGNRINF